MSKPYKAEENPKDDNKSTNISTENIFILCILTHGIFLLCPLKR